MTIKVTPLLPPSVFGNPTGLVPSAQPGGASFVAQNANPAGPSGGTPAAGANPVAGQRAPFAVPTGNAPAQATQTMGTSLYNTNASSYTPLFAQFDQRESQQIDQLLGALHGTNA
ncbi:MAG TPA: hypothetical protein VEA41_16415 [Salinarimonas sp.]|jgi:hypothetical protein|nr:hypothetical protein [Salinarimonas sp.]